MTIRGLHLSAPDLLSCQGVPVVQLLLMDLEVPKKNEKTAINKNVFSLIHFILLNMQILYVFENAAE